MVQIVTILSILISIFKFFFPIFFGKKGFVSDSTDECSHIFVEWAFVPNTILYQTVCTYNCPSAENLPDSNYFNTNALETTGLVLYIF